MQAKPLKPFGRRAVSASLEDRVSFGTLDGPGLPLATPAVAGVDLIEWARHNREAIDAHLKTTGAVLFRGFEAGRLDSFETFIRAVSDDVIDYSDHTSPRTKIAPNIHTSTEYPADQTIFLHNENCYQRTWPLKFFLLCVVAPPEGGETPICDCRRVLQKIDPEVLEPFLRKGWMLQRNFGDGFGLPWQEAFYTDDPKAVERYCVESDVQFEWKEGGRLRTRQTRPAVARHPKTGENLWFNHVAFFHVSGLQPSVREALLAEFREEDLPYNTFYGDGTPIEPAVIQHLREVYWAETVSFRWEVGDLLIVDNMLMAHGRYPYSGPRRVLVGMAEPTSWETLAAAEATGV